MSNWAPDTAVQNPHEAPAIADTTATDIQADADGGVIIQRWQDVEPIFEHNAALAAEGNCWSESGELLHLGNIPALIVELYCNTRGVTFEQFMADNSHAMAILNDPALSKCTIWEQSAHKSYR